MLKNLYYYYKSLPKYLFKYSTTIIEEADTEILKFGKKR